MNPLEIVDIAKKVWKLSHSAGGKYVRGRWERGKVA